MYEKIMKNLNEAKAKSKIKKFLIEKGIAEKLSNLRKGPYYCHNFYDRFIFNKTKELFGGRVRYFITGSAPIDPAVLDFLKICVCAPIMEGYG